jgi:hypothetical protein
MRTIQEWMGHEDPDTTAIYAHYQPAAQEVSVIDRAFGSPETGFDSAAVGTTAHLT